MALRYPRPPFATEAGCFQITDPALIWRLATHADRGRQPAGDNGDLSQASPRRNRRRPLCMTGIGDAEGKSLPHVLAPFAIVPN